MRITLEEAARSVGHIGNWERRTVWFRREAENLRIRSFQSPQHPRLGHLFDLQDVQQHWLECVRGIARQRPRRTR